MTNLPVELTSFVGRRQDLVDLKHLLATTRLLTLTGAGGVGKTRLGVRVARELARQYPDGTWFVDLAPVRDPQFVAQAMFDALGLQDLSASWSISRLTEYLADQRMLVVLDNCEHVLDSAAVLAGTLLRACPDLRILATSRQALGVTGEVVVDVPALPLPPGGDSSPSSLLRSDAVALFVERASTLQPGFEVDASNAAAILELCERVDGIPLALELAAVRLKALGLEGLVQGIGDHLGALGTGDRSGARRQQTLEATIDWSYQLLSPPERALWAGISVFSGGFELDAAQHVCTDPGLSSQEISTVLGALVEKSVVKRDQSSGTYRFRLLETLRQFGRERLREAGDEMALQIRHRAWIVDLAAAAGTPDEHQVAAFERIRVERANVWSALDFCLIDPEGAEFGALICRGLWPYWASQGPASKVRQLYAALIERLPPLSRSRGHLLWISAQSAATQGELALALQSGTEALKIGRATGDPEVVAWSLQSLGVVAFLGTQWDDAIAYATESLNLARSMGFPFTVLSSITLLGTAYTFHGELDQGIATAWDGIRLSEELGEIWERAYLLNFLALALMQTGEPAEAEMHARRCLELKSALGDLAGMAMAVEGLALIATDRGLSERAATLLGAGDALWRSIPTKILEPYRAGHDRAEAEGRAALGDARFDKAHRLGTEMTRDEVVDYVLGVPNATSGRATAKPKEPDLPLSRREMEVARVVASGATNAQVAAQLFISERTVESHLASIFNKLGVDSRMQVARWVASTEVTTPAR